MQWVAVYNDNTYLPQYNESGERNRYEDIQRDNLSRFIVFNEENGKVILVVHFERPSQQLIWRERTWVNSMKGEVLGRIFLAGWQENIEGKSVKCISYIYSDGHIELAGARDDDKLCMANDIVIREQEK